MPQLVFTARLRAAEEAGAGSEVGPVARRHVAAALRETRPSVSRAERARLEALYAAFGAGRPVEDVRRQRAVQR